MTPRLEDLIPPPRQVLINPIKGLVDSLQPKGISTVRYIIQDDPDRDIQLFTRGVLYYPDMPITLVSPQCLCKSVGNSHIFKCILTESNTTCIFYIGV